MIYFTVKGFYFFKHLEEIKEYSYQGIDNIFKQGMNQSKQHRYSLCVVN